MKVLNVTAYLPLLLIAGASIAAAPASRIVLPLSDADTARIQESGCESGFTVARTNYVFAMNNRMVVRTAAGAKVCGVDGAILDAFFEGDRSLTCGGATLRITQAGKHKANMEADSVSGPATLTVTQGKLRQVLRGESGTAC